MGENAVSIIGTVRATSESKILARAGGTVTSVNTTLGASVPPGFAIATLDNARERAAVLQAQGVYEAAVAQRNTFSLDDTAQAARDAYQAAYTVLDTTLENDLASFFGATSAFGPLFLLTSANIEERTAISRERARIDERIDAFKLQAESTTVQDPQLLLNEAESIVRAVQTLLTRIALVVNENDSRATQEQIEDLATARATIDSLIGRVLQARTGLRTETIGATAASDAQVKQALGALRAAEASLEETIIRSPIGGQVEFLPIRVGEYVSAFDHVATVAQNGALEIIAYVGEAQQDAFSVGAPVRIQDQYAGVVTSIAPALDPIRKQIEVRIAVNEETQLLNGESIRITSMVETTEEVRMETPTVLLLPLTSVKLRSTDRVVFSIADDMTLVATPVTVGDVRGDRIEILSSLPRDLTIVTDVRGFTEGEVVRIIESAE
jgi:multidrug resistance efflux pump